MEKSQLVLAGTIVSLIGCLTILLRWVGIYYEDYYGTLYYSYNGITIVTTGDFTDPDGLFYGVGIIGVYTPIMICLAFVAMTARYLAKVDRPYFNDILSSGILIAVGSVYMMWWVNPGHYYDEYFTEIHEFGAGPFVAIVVAIISVVIAYNIDHSASHRHTDATAYQPPIAVNGCQTNPDVQSQQPQYAMYCPYCGKGLTKEESDGTVFCKYCGKRIGPSPERTDE